MSCLGQQTVLVLNRNWQALQVRTPEVAFGMLANGSATALDDLVPVRWADWIKLPIRPGDDFVNTPNQQIRIPRVIIAVNFSRVVPRKKVLTMRTLRERDQDTCAYTGRKLKPHECSKDHVIPRSRGGGNSWDNIVLAHRDVNSRKGARTPEEAGLQLRHKPTAPREVLPAHTITPRFPEWEPFLK